MWLPRLLSVGAIVAVIFGACSSAPGPARRGAREITPTTSSSALSTTTTTTGKALPPAAPEPVFSAEILAVTAADLPSTYRAGCPVAPSQLRTLLMSHWGFDGAPHVGVMVVNASVADQVVGVFARLFAERFPIRLMAPVDEFGGSDPESMAADNTSGFNCRNAVADGPPRWSAHAYGTAIDINPVENPYLQGGEIQPIEGSAYLDRADVRPGMATPEGVLNRAFADVGWQWGGRWAATPDYQHFSSSGG